MNTSPAQMNDQNSQSNNAPNVTNDNYVNAYTPPASDAPASTSDNSATINGTGSAGAPVSSTTSSTPSAENSAQAPTSDNSAPQSETLEDQNIFFLLGVRDGTDQQKEAFLDELQQVIWEDFLEFDVKLLITSEEMVQLQSLLTSQTDKDLEKQEKIVVYLEKLIPDLEDIMLEKALELKEEMVRERAAGLKQYYAEKPEKIQRIDEAEQQMNAGKWNSAAHLMNSLGN